MQLQKCPFPFKEILMRKATIIASTLALVLGAASAQTATTTAAPAQVTLTDVPAGHWAKDAVDAITKCGLIQGFPDGTFRGNENLTRYQAALIFHRLLTSGALSTCGLSQGDMTTVMKGMQEVSTELAAISNRVTDLEKANADQAARIAALEERINAAGNGAASADVAALNARIDALELAIRNIPAGPQGPQGPKGDKGDKGDAGTAAVVTTPVATTPATDVVVIGTDPVVDVAAKNLYAGVSIGAMMVDGATVPCYQPDAKGKAVGYCVTGGAMIGSKSVIGPVGVRVAGEYAPGRNGFNADVNAMYHLDTASMISPYVGLGLGLSSSTTRDTTDAANKTGTDTYVSGVIGTDINITDSIAAYVEGNARYYMSGNGTAAPTNKGGVGFAAKTGVKFFF